ncbi:signal recognition particle-docking protein FtsY [Nitrososphaera sp.]|uniref:signal recognition particle-docking protein FtsY n=1 Tax=Nitrososphaera sp. TaxID=1971748 RepID=UPI0017F0DFC1|nr:signal recognition particle-docking protein FtsY [Nitrososphaera sp.]NWG36175.1 signal recognition particle-docking protein FtsY [Nitrososphaera sp.]
MFDKLKNAFSSAARSIGQKEITERVLDDTLLDLQIALLESDVAQEVVDDLSKKLKQELLGVKLEKGQEAGAIIEKKLQESVAGIFARAGRLDLVSRIKAKKEAKQGPFSIVFLGINGTGKTTTVAKVANLLRKQGLSVVVAAGDTHRAGAIEQLTEHAQRLSLKVIAQRYGADPSAVGRDALDYARKHYIDVVLMDTAGRMQTSKNLMDEMGKIVRVVKPDVKLFVGDSLAGNDTINQAREFFQYTNFDGAILTKIDADAKGGAAISISHLTAKPIIYVGVGQGYDDMIPFDPDRFIESLFGKAEVSVQDLMSAPPPAPGPAAGEEPKVEAPPAAPVSTPVSAPIEEPEPREERDFSPPPAPVQVPKPPPPPPAPEPAKAEPEEKKGRFGFFGRKREEDREEGKKQDERQRKEDEKRRQEEEKRKKKEEDERRKREEEERKRREKEEKKKRKDDKDKKEDEVVYLTDEDIEDLLK